MTELKSDVIDFTMMYATHAAFRRDLDRLIAAADAGVTGSPTVRAGWENFKFQIHLHHTVEDTYLWPLVARKVAGRPRDLALSKEMEAEHSQLDPLIAKVDRALAAQTPDLPEFARNLSAAIGGHLSHEEDAALPLMQSVLTQADWRGFRSAMTRAQGIKGGAVYIPWVMDDRPPAARQEFLAQLPPPARLINRLVWERRYQQRNLWKV